MSVYWPERLAPIAPMHVQSGHVDTNLRGAPALVLAWGTQCWKIEKDRYRIVLPTVLQNFIGYFDAGEFGSLLAADDPSCVESNFLEAVTVE